MSNDTEIQHYSEMIDAIEALSDDELAKELAFAEGFGVGSNDAEFVAVWREAVRHESRCRGVFVVGDDCYDTVEDWMRDSDYVEAAGDWWTEGGASGPYDPLETYAYAHQAMTWADALDSVMNP